MRFHGVHRSSLGVLLFVAALGSSWAFLYATTPRGPVVQVRWGPSVTAAQRLEIEQQHRLVEGIPAGDSTWRYELLDPSGARLREIVATPEVEDTAGFDRANPTGLPGPARIGTQSLLCATAIWLVVAALLAALAVGSTAWAERSAFVDVLVEGLRSALDGTRRHWRAGAAAALLTGLCGLTVGLLLLPKGIPIHVRWVPELDVDERSLLEERLGITNGLPLEGTTWRYELLHTSADDLQRLIEQPEVEDTDGFDRARLVAPRAPWTAPGFGIAAGAIAAGFVLWGSAIRELVIQAGIAWRFLARRHASAVGGAAVATLGILAHWPYLVGLGFYWDEWASLSVAQRLGPEALVSNGFDSHPWAYQLWAAAYQTFGSHAWTYHLWVLAAQIVLALGVAWIASELWPRSVAGFASAALVVTYPGFGHYQFGYLYVVGMSFAAMHVISLGATLALPRALGRQERAVGWGVSLSLATLAGFGLFPYLAMMEPYRLVLIGYQEAGRAHASIGRTVRRSLARWAPFGIVWAAVLTWGAVFRPQAGDPARDVATVVGIAIADPLSATFRIASSATTSAWNVTVVPWAQALALTFSSAHAHWRSPAVVGSVIATFSITFWMTRGVHLGRHGTPRARRIPIDMCLLGMTGLLAGIGPVAVAGRAVDVATPGLDRYSLACIAVVGLLVAGAMMQALRARALALGLATLVAVSSFPHQQSAAIYRDVWQSLRSVAWQLAWRVPGLEPNAILVEALPLPNGGSTVIPYQAVNKLEYPLRLAYPGLSEVLVVGNVAHEQRLRILIADLAADDHRVLVMIQPTPESCLRIVDSQYPAETPVGSAFRRRMVVPVSNPRMIRETTDYVSPNPWHLFGSEPDRGFCYQYQVASLAAQKRDWAGAAQAADAVFQHALSPADPIEWLPFIDGLLMEGRSAEASALIARVQTREGGTEAICSLLGRLLMRPGGPAGVSAGTHGCHPGTE